MKLITQNFQTKKQIEQIIKEATDIKLAVAFWGYGSSETIKIAKNKKIKIICNLESGATNPYEIIKIGTLIGFKNIRSVKNLHAKVYLTDKKLVLGSSNFSANGLSLEGDETNKLIEANILIEQPSMVKQTDRWFNSLWSGAKEIDEKYCQICIPKWAKRRVITEGQIIEPDFFKAYENGSYNEENIYIIVDTRGFTIAEEKVGDKIAKESFNDDLFYAGKEISYWHGYKTVPRDKHIINYFFESNGKLIYYGIWKTLPKNYDRKNWQFCYKVSDKLIMKNHINQITAILKNNTEELHLANDGLEMNLSDFYKRFKPSK
jgi:hypothetical protein